MAYRGDARFHAVQVLTEFDRKNQRLSEILHAHFSSTFLPLNTRSEITHLVQETTRWRGFLDHVLSRCFSGRLHKTQYPLRNILRLGAYEIIFRRQVPPYASVSEAVELTRLIVGEKASGISNAVLRQIQGNDSPNLKAITEDDPPERIAAHLSHPDWLIARWLKQFGFEKTLKLCKWNNRTPVFTLRRNHTKVQGGTFEAFLTKQKIRWEKKSPLGEFYSVDQISALRNSKEFKKGWFSIQDLSAGLVTLLLGADSSSIIVDVCAAPGGKITFLAERLGNRGTVKAYDIDEERLLRLRDNVRRLGLDSIQILQADATRSEYPMADVILLDVPCTGTGVMAKRADLRWRREERDIALMSALQIRILSHMSSFVRKRGIVVYATCSVEQEENWAVVDSFLNVNRQFRVRRSEELVPGDYVDQRGALCTFPPDHGLDGVFAVILERTG